MSRKGYASELLAKKELEDAYGKQNCIKVAIGSFGGDFIVLHPYSNEIVKIVEVKETHRKKYYPSAREKVQLARIKTFAKLHDIKAELWIRKPGEPFNKKPI